MLVANTYRYAGRRFVVVVDLFRKSGIQRNHPARLCPYNFFSPPHPPSRPPGVIAKFDNHFTTRPSCVRAIHYTRCQRCQRALADASIFHIALVSGEKTNFQFILRLLNTNVDGKQKVMYALTKIKGVGRRYSNLVCKKADVDLNKR